MIYQDRSLGGIRPGVSSWNSTCVLYHTGMWQLLAYISANCPSLSLQDYPDALITNYYVRVVPSTSCSVSFGPVMPRAWGPHGIGIPVRVAFSFPTGKHLPSAFSYIDGGMRPGRVGVWVSGRSTH